jgi:adenylosuccinate synthase
MEAVIVLSGPIGAEKSSFGRALVDHFGAVKVGTRDYILRRKGCENERRALQDAGDALDEETGGTWVSDCVQEAAASAGPHAVLLLDSARIAPQVRTLRARFPDKVFHIHLHAGIDELERRYLNRDRELKEFSTYAEASAHGTEAQVGTLAELSDLVLDADHADPATLAITAMAVRGTQAQPVEPLVDVIVGGQYGSEGKGNICAHLARDYGALMRIGGPNAGHKVADPKYNYVQLP